MGLTTRKVQRAIQNTLSKGGNSQPIVLRQRVKSNNQPRLEEFKDIDSRFMDTNMFEFFQKSLSELYKGKEIESREIKRLAFQLDKEAGLSVDRYAQNQINTFKRVISTEEEVEKVKEEGKSFFIEMLDKFDKESGTVISERYLPGKNNNPLTKEDIDAAFYKGLTYTNQKLISEGLLPLEVIENNPFFNQFNSQSERKISYEVKKDTNFARYGSLKTASEIKLSTPESIEEDIKRFKIYGDSLYSEMKQAYGKADLTSQEMIDFIALHEFGHIFDSIIGFSERQGYNRTLAKNALKEDVAKSSMPYYVNSKKYREMTDELFADNFAKEAIRMGSMFPDSLYTKQWEKINERARKIKSGLITQQL